MKTLQKQKVGLGFAIIACVLFWIPIYSIEEYILFIPIKTGTINILPSLASGLISIVLVFLIYIRGIISFKHKKLRLASILINWALFSTFVELFLFPLERGTRYDALANNLLLIIICAAFVAVLLFGVKEIAKLVLLMFIIGSFFSNFILVSNSMGVLGFLALACIITSFYLQGNISLASLKTETHYLYSKKASL